MSELLDRTLGERIEVRTVLDDGRLAGVCRQSST